MIEKPKRCFFCKYGEIEEPFEHDIPCKDCSEYDKFEPEEHYEEHKTYN